MKMKMLPTLYPTFFPGRGYPNRNKFRMQGAALNEEKTNGFAAEKNHSGTACHATGKGWQQGLCYNSLSTHGGQHRERVFRFNV